MDYQNMQTGRMIRTWPLETGAPVSVTLGGDEVQCYTLTLESEAIAWLFLEVNGLRGSLTILNPEGESLRSSEIDSDGQYSLAFVAEKSGAYRVQLKAQCCSLERGNYTIALKEIATLEERVKAAPAARLEGTRIQKLRADLTLDPAAALAEFWQEMNHGSSPLLETDPLSPHLTRCTFVWRGTEQTRNVQVRLLFRTTLPNEYAMTRLEDTDVWYTTIQLPSCGRFSYMLLPNAPLLPQPEFDSPAEHKLRYLVSAQADPLNPRRCYDAISKYEGMSLLELPGASPQPWIDERREVSRGILKRYPFKSKVLNDDRFVSVYTPHGYSEKEKPYGLLLVFDEQWYLTRVPTPTILDNLLAEGEIPPLLGVFIGNGPGEARSRQLPCNPRFAEFMATELLPWVQQNYCVTGDPGRVILAGSSYGGLASAYVALEYPELFGNVLSQSGSFWWRLPEKPGQILPHPSGETNYIASSFARSPRLPLRFYLDAGSGEIDLTGKGRSILFNTRYLRDVLLAKGYPVHYREFIGGHDFLNWRGTLADGLILLTADWSMTAHRTIGENRSRKGD